jgi:hypothetical protein
MLVAHEHNLPNTEIKWMGCSSTVIFLLLREASREGRGITVWRGVQ